MDDILQNACQYQVVVTHGFALTFVIASWMKLLIESLGYANFRAVSGSITVLHEDDYFHSRQIDSLASTRHFDS